MGMHHSLLCKSRQCTMEAGMQQEQQHCIRVTDILQSRLYKTAIF